MMKETKTAIRAAKKGGEIAMKYFGKPLEHKTKSSFFDWVTKADLESEEKIVKILKKEYPEYGILAEESGEHKGNEFQWIVDPIDGTNNFASGIPFFCIAIALAKEGELLSGVVFVPSMNELFYAEKGKGAFLNGEKIEISNRSNLKEFICISSIRSGLKKEEAWRIKQERFADLYKNVRSMRMMGASEVELSYIAAGRIDAFTGYHMKPWDGAAGSLLIREAGGKATNQKNKPWQLNDRVLIASNGKKHKKILKILSG